MNRINAFTIDVEDGLSLAMRDAFGVAWEQTDRVVINTLKILEILANSNTKGTFFILGQVAEKFPNLIKRIIAGGHEIGVHGYDHKIYFELTHKEIFRQITKTKKLLEDISGKPIYGHRAPAFSISSKNSSVLDLINEAGFLYDSSLFPFTGKKSVEWSLPYKITYINTSKGYRIIEVPLSTLNFINIRIPALGGSYLRLCPLLITKAIFNRIQKKQSGIVYLHPYEIDNERYPDYYFKELNKTNVIKNLKMRSMWINRRYTQTKISEILRRYQFDTLINLIKKELKLKDVTYP